MTKKESLQLFEEKKVRTVWDDKEESLRAICARLSAQDMMCGQRISWEKKVIPTLRAILLIS